MGHVGTATGTLSLPKMCSTHTVFRREPPDGVMARSQAGECCDNIGHQQRGRVDACMRTRRLLGVPGVWRAV
jgi:hypothetical protein